MSQQQDEQLGGIEKLYGRKLSTEEHAEARLNLVGLLEVLIEIDQEVTRQPNDGRN